MILARHLLPEQLGIWALFTVVTTVFETTKVGLLKNAHILYVTGTQDTHQRTVIASSSLLINAMITFISVLLILFCGSWLSRLLGSGEDLNTILHLFIPGLIAMVVFSHMEAISQSHLDFKGVFAGYFVRQVVFFGIICTHVLLKIPIALQKLSVYWSISIFAGTIFIYWYSRPYLHNKFNPSWDWIRKITGYGKYIFGSGLISNLYTNMDQLMTAGVMKMPAVVASYSISNRINQVIDVPSFAAADVIFPKVSMASAQEGEAKVKYLYERMVALLSCFVVPLTLTIIIFAKWVVLIVGGSQYVAQATPILQLYMITGLLRPMQNQAANLLNSIGKPALCFILNAVTLGANLFISYLCIKHFGYIGAAIASVFTYGLSLPVWYYVIKRLVGAEARNIIAYMREYYILLFQKGVGMLKGVKAVRSTDNIS